MVQGEQLHILKRVYQKSAAVHNRTMSFHTVTILFGCERECVWPYHSTQDDAIHLHFHRNGRA